MMSITRAGRSWQRRFSQMNQLEFYGSLGIFPGLFDNNQGLLSQNSSSRVLRCCTVILALAFLFLSFSACVLEISFSSEVLAESWTSASMVVPGSTSSYWSSIRNLGLWWRCGSEKRRHNSHRGTIHCPSCRYQVRYYSSSWTSRTRSRSYLLPMSPIAHQYLPHRHKEFAGTLTESSFSALCASIPPNWTNAQNVVLNKLLMWPSHPLVTVPWKYAIKRNDSQSEYLQLI